ncbi:MAG TPA: hypothetical protein VKT81_03530 [Bryobacteraceae bacterium]|nr:hypothetical protein [Bryobacteraceae bacterium]
MRLGIIIPIAALLFAPASLFCAKTEFSFSNCALQGSNFTVSGNCIVNPFGAMAVTVTLANSPKTTNVTFTFSSSAGMFTASDPNQPYTVTVGSDGTRSTSFQGAANLTSGTDEFASGAGGFAFTFQGSTNANATSQTATIGGSGNVDVQLSLTATLPDATVGVPYSVNVAQGQIGIPQGAQFSIAAGSSLPPGLTLASSGLLSGTPTQAGDDKFSITFGQDATLQASLTVAGNSSPAIQVTPGALTFSITEGATAPATQSLIIANRGSSAETFSVTENSGGNFLSVSPSSGTVAPFTNSALSVKVDPTGLKSGTYTGTLSVATAPGTQQFDVAVLVTVSGTGVQLHLSQSGFRFQAQVGGGNPPPQTFAILSSGSKPLNFSAATSMTSTGDWLAVSPDSGAAIAGAPATATVRIQASGLKAGDYYGQIQISAGGAENSPQTASVVLNVAGLATDPGAFVSPTGLIFVGQTGGADPAAKMISVTHSSTATLTYSAASFFYRGNNWFTVKPAAGTVDSTHPVDVIVQPVLAGLLPGVYTGEIVIQFAEDNSSRHVAVVLVVTPAGASPAAGHDVSAACTPTKLLPVFTQLGANFTAVAAWPTPIEVTIVDDCGNFMTSGSATASFSNSDPSLPLTSLDDGRWSATWQPGSSSAPVVITADAAENPPPLTGTASIGGALQANPTTPAVNPGGIVSAAKYASNQPLAPGSFISIYGVHLSAGQNPALSLPLQTQLGDTQAVLGGRAMPLQYTSGGQINAVVPFDVPPNTTQQLIISNGPALSVPQPVVIAPAQPDVFARANGAGVVFDVKPGKTAQVLVDVSHPMSAGDAIVIYCAGLGPVNQHVTAGSAAPSSPPATTNDPVTVTIGGKSAQVFFGGLVGGFAGLYQVNAYVPKGIAPGDAVPLVVTVAGFGSAAVTVAVK